MQYGSTGLGCNYRGNTDLNRTRTKATTTFYFNLYL